MEKTKAFEYWIKVEGVINRTIADYITDNAEHYADDGFKHLVIDALHHTITQIEGVIK